MASEDPEKTKEVRKYLQQSHDRIFENNKKWADEMKTKKPEFFKDLAAGQAPEYLWIGTYHSSLAISPLPSPRNSNGACSTTTTT
jgi:carbonic anhydrase